MLKGLVGLPAILALLCTMSNACLAQAAQIQGKWNGSLENWPYDNGNGGRDLIIESATSCRWGIAGKQTGMAKSCAVSEVNGVVQLVLKTSADSTVTLSLREDALVGGFQLKGGGTLYRVTMKRVP